MGISKYTDELAEEICTRIANGEPLRAICRDDHMPNWTTVYAWINADPELARRIARARELGADAIAEDTINIIDTPPERVATPMGSKIDPGYVQWQKNRVEQRLKLLSKWQPKKYGERVDHTSSDGSMSPPQAIEIVHVKPAGKD